MISQEEGKDAKPMVDLKVRDGFQDTLARGWRSMLSLRKLREGTVPQVDRSGSQHRVSWANLSERD